MYQAQHRRKQEHGIEAPRLTLLENTISEVRNAPTRMTVIRKVMYQVEATSIPIMHQIP
jgi:hypothetical protein